MSQDNGGAKLSFAERLAKSKQEAETKANPSAKVSASSAKNPTKNPAAYTYFHSSIDTFRFIVSPGYTAAFKDNFLVTDDKEVIEAVNRDFINRVGSRVKVKEVSVHFYDNFKTHQIAYNEPISDEPQSEKQADQQTE